MSEISEALNETQPAISLDLSHLRAANLVTGRRAGHNVFYELGVGVQADDGALLRVNRAGFSVRLFVR
jgi:DNA-binding transcriptional ArsR family regulator